MQFLKKSSTSILVSSNSYATIHSDNLSINSYLIELKKDFNHIDNSILHSNILLMTGNFPSNTIFELVIKNISPATIPKVLVATILYDEDKKAILASSGRTQNAIGSFKSVKETYHLSIPYSYAICTFNVIFADGSTLTKTSKFKR